MIRPSSRSSEHLSGKEYVTLVLRVVVNDRRQIVQGELIDAVSTQTIHFRKWRGLLRAISGWLKNRSARSADASLTSKQS